MLGAKCISDAVVLELGGRAAVAVAGSLLHGAGARVIRITPPGPMAIQTAEVLSSAGKEQVEIDFSVAEGIARLHELTARADILLISSDVDPACIASLTPREGQIVCDISAGVIGEPLDEWQLQAAAGLVHTTGWPDGAPQVIALPIVNCIAGFYAAIGVLGHLLSGAKSPARIDVSMIAGAFVTLNSFLAGALQPNGIDPSRVGNRHTAVAPWNCYPTRDGAIIICAGNRPQWRALCELMGRQDLDRAYPNQDLRLANIEEVDGAISAWTVQHDTADVETRLLKAGIAAGRILDVDRYPDDKNLELRGLVRGETDATGRTVYMPSLPIGLRRLQGAPCSGADLMDLPAKPASSMQQLSLPLAGLKVVEMGQFTTAPLCGRTLAALGADVLKIEKPGGDEQRYWQGGTHSIAETFWLNNTGKRSACLDLNNTNDRDRLAAILASADLLVENFKPGTLAKFGFDEPRLKSLNPRLVHCAISGFGSLSAYPGRPGFDMVIQGMSGFMSALAPGMPPMKSGISVADIMGALAGLVASLGALARREQAGGTFVDLSMQDITAWLTAPAWNGGSALPTQPVVLKADDGYVVAAKAPTKMPLGSRSRIAQALNSEGIATSPIATIREAAFSTPLHNGAVWKLFDLDGQLLPILGLPLNINGRAFLKYEPAPAVQDDQAEAHVSAPEQSPAC